MSKFEEIAIKVNSKEFNILKVVEETSELNEVLVKTLTKSGKNKPPDAKIVEELGDTIVRCKILANIYGWDAVNARIKEKEEALMNHYLDKLSSKEKTNDSI